MELFGFEVRRRSYIKTTATRHTRVWSGDGNIYGSVLESVNPDFCSFDDLEREANIRKHHAPVFDLDFEAELIPSSTPGHSHLYFNKPCTWGQYKRMLKAMWKAGYIEKGYYKATVRARQAFVRKPGIVKPGFTKQETLDASKQKAEVTLEKIKGDLRDEGIRSFLLGIRAVAEAAVHNNESVDPLDVISMINLAFQVAENRVPAYRVKTYYGETTVDNIGERDLLKLFESIDSI